MHYILQTKIIQHIFFALHNGMVRGGKRGSSNASFRVGNIHEYYARCLGLRFKNISVSLVSVPCLKLYLHYFSLINSIINGSETFSVEYEPIKKL